MHRIGNSLRGAMSPSMIVALIALFVALGGTAYATQSQQRQNVLGAQIVTRIALSETLQPGQSRIAAAACPTGYAAIGGGSQHLHDYRFNDNWDTLESGPAFGVSVFNPTAAPWGESGMGVTYVPKQLPAPTGWAAAMSNAGPAPEARFMVAVVCAKVVVYQR